MAKKRRKQVEKKSNIIYIALVLVFVAIVYIAVSQTSERASQEEVIPEGKFVKLNKASTYEPGKVKIIEFLKFNCGHCYTLHQMLPNLEKKYEDKIELEVTYIPIVWNTIPTDRAFIKSNEAYILAEKMGKGKEMRDALFKAYFVDRKDITNIAVLEDIGKNLSLGDEFVTALRNGDAKKEAERDIKLAESYNVVETPTIIINGNLKVTPSIAGGGVESMVIDLDTIIGSFV